MSDDGDQEEGNLVEEEEEPGKAPKERALSMKEAEGELESADPKIQINDTN